MEKIKTRPKKGCTLVKEFKLCIREFRSTGQVLFLKRAVQLLPNVLLLLLLLVYVSKGVTNLQGVCSRGGMHYPYVHNVVQVGVRLGLFRRVKKGRVSTTVLTPVGVLCAEFLLGR